MRKTQLLKMIRQHKDVSWCETPQENKAYLEKLLDAWKQLYTKKVSDKVETQEAEQLEVKGDTTGLTQLLKHLTTPGETSLYRRVFKISGTIGDSKTGGMNYINLCSQVVDAKNSGYKDQEIAIAIKKAISPGSVLRTYFDTLSALPLEKMLHVLRDYYREKTPTELFTELSTLCQGAREESMDFLLRGFEARQRVMAASLAEGGIYDERLVRDTFCRSVRTGLRDGNIRAAMKQFLDPRKPIEDETLLRELNIASSESQETTQKQKATSRIMINEVAEKETKIEDSIASAIKPLVAGMNAMKEQIQGIQDRNNNSLDSRRINSNNNNNNRPRRFRPGGYRCQKCSDENIFRCIHCFKCGSNDGHQMRDCTSGKGQRL